VHTVAYADYLLFPFGEQDGLTRTSTLFSH
jgi:hypothetical protein